MYIMYFCIGLFCSAFLDLCDITSKHHFQASHIAFDILIFHGFGKIEIFILASQINFLFLLMPFGLCGLKRPYLLPGFKGSCPYFLLIIV